MPRPRTLPVINSTKACVIGLVVGTATFPVLLAVLGRGETAIPPVAFITIAALCWGIIPRVCVEFLPAPRGASAGGGASATGRAADRR